jgi:hypothetical protein
MFRV